MQNMKKAGIILILSLTIGFVKGQSDNLGLKEKLISSSEHNDWTVLGKGKVEISGTRITMQESDDSKGIMMVSPGVYSSDVILRYKTLALTSATVLTAFLSVSDVGESENLTIPDDYDGSLGLWTKEKENYFFLEEQSSF